MRKTLNNKSGFTLIELMIAVLISGVVITAVYQIMQTSSQASAAANGQVAAANSLDTTMENIRQLTMQSTKVTICDAEGYTSAEGESVIRCSDNKVYSDEIIIGSAAQYGVDHIELNFDTKQDDTILVVELNCYDENGGIIDGKSRNLDLFMQSIGGDGKGEIDKAAGGNHNCIVYSSK